MSTFLVVTGAPRSGTTAVGETLAAASRVSELYEPLSYESGLRSVDRYFPVPTDSRMEYCSTLIRSVTSLRFRLKNGVFRSDHGVRRIVKQFVGGQTKMSYRKLRLGPTPATVIWKDPFAAFLVPALARDFGIRSVVTVRSPLAIAASFKRMGWSFDDAPAVLRELRELAPESFNDIDDDVAHSSVGHPVVSGALYWRMIYGFLALQADDQAVYWIGIDRLVSAPVLEYSRLFEWAGLPFDGRVRKKIDGDYSRPSASVPRADRAHDRNRDPKSVGTYWRDSIDASERALVTDIVGTLPSRVDARVEASMGPGRPVH